MPALANQLELQSRLLRGLADFHGEFLGVRIARKHQTWFLESLVQQGVLGNLAARDFRRSFNGLGSAQAQARYHEGLATHLLKDRMLLAA